MPGSNLTAEARDVLEERRFAVIATINEDGSPHQTVVWYFLRGDDIVMNTARGRVKERNLRRDPRLAITVEDGDRFLTLWGTARLVDDVATAQEDIRQLATHTRLDRTARAVLVTVPTRDGSLWCPTISS